jgi:hypothetical protein
MMTFHCTVVLSLSKHVSRFALTFEAPFDTSTRSALRAAVMFQPNVITLKGETSGLEQYDISLYRRAADYNDIML